jgi:hypothetical protein
MVHKCAKKNPGKELLDFFVGLENIFIRARDRI